MLTYFQMEAVLQEIQSQLLLATFRSCVENDPHQILLNLDSSKALLLSFQDPFLRFNLLKTQQEGRNTPFSKHLEKTLRGSRLIDIQLVNQDRILQLTFKKGNIAHLLLAEFFPRRSNLYLLNPSNHVIASFRPTSIEAYQPPTKPVAPTVTGPLLTNDKIEKLYEKQESTFLLEKERKALEKVITTLLNRTEANKLKTLNHLQLAENWSEIQHEGLLLQAHLYQIKKGATQITVTDWVSEQPRTIELDPNIEPNKNVVKFFQRAKKLELSIPHTQSLLEKIEVSLTKYRHYLEQLSAAHSIEEIETLKEQISPPKEKKEILPFHTFLTEANLAIWVGKGAKQNDILTFQYAKGSDWWLHARDYPGAHVVLRVAKGAQPDEESLQDAVQLALFYSKNKSDGEVCITQCKYVSRFGKEKAGKVHISKQQVVFATLDPARIQRLKKKNST